MSDAIPLGFLLQIPGKRFSDVYACLIGNAEEYPQDICYLVVNIIFFSFFKGLVTVFTGHHSGQFSDFFGKNSHIGEFAEVAYSILLNPAIYLMLSLF